MTSVPAPSDHPADAGLSLAPFRALRAAGPPDVVARRLCPPYDVIDTATRQRLLAQDPENAVALILPDPTPAGYRAAAEELDRRVAAGVYVREDRPTLYVYEMRTGDGAASRGLVGAVELRDPADGVILPHENTMAGPVADRLELMTATDSDLEPIYLVYDGGGAASAVVRDVDADEPLLTTTTQDGVTHRLWAVVDPDMHAAVDADLRTRHALIADGHHRYATYRERQRIRRAAAGPGPWDRGLTLLVDSSDYGPQVHAIHRSVAGLALDEAVSGLGGLGHVETLEGDTGSEVGLASALTAAAETPGFAAVVTDGTRAVLVTDPDGALRRAALRDDDPPALAELDVTVLHRAVIERAWQRADDEATVGYAHSVPEALDQASAHGGVAVLLRPTPVAAVAGVAAAGARMPRKSTLFTPKPASGLLLRRLLDQA